MATFQHVLVQGVRVGTKQLAKPLVIEAPQRLSLAVAAPPGLNVSGIVFDLDVSAAKSFFLVSDRDVAFRTNEALFGDDQILLKANVPYVWHTQSYTAFLLATDITQGIFIQNNGGIDANVEIEALTDPTP